MVGVGVARCKKMHQNTQMLQCGSQTVGHAFDRQTRVTGIESQPEPRLGRHLRALRASAYICYENRDAPTSAPIVMAGHVRHVPAISRDKLSLRTAVGDARP
jgi:hypothetical protein